MFGDMRLILQRTAMAILCALVVSPYALHAQNFNSVDTTAQLTYFNSRVMPPNAYRVLFIGDSLTYHAQIPGLWDYTSGMAATSPAQDFVHLAVAHMQQKVRKRSVEMLVNNGGNGKLGTMLAYLQQHPDLKPELVVLQGGENDHFDDTYRTTYRALLDFFAANHAPYIVLGDWWGAEKSRFDQAEAASRGYSWVDLLALWKDPSLSGYGGPYNIPGVAKHPNDKGMQAIATAINERFDRAVLPKVKSK